MDYQDFLEQIRIKGHLHMPVMDGKNETNLLLVQKKDDEKIRISDGNTHILHMPELDVREVYRQCGNCFNEGILRKILQEYTKTYMQAVEQDKKEQELLFDIMLKIPKEKICFILFPQIPEEKILQRYAGRKMDNVYLVYTVILGESEDRIKLSAVTKEMLKYWEVSEDDLYQMSVKNMTRKFLYGIEKFQLITGEHVYFIKSEQNCYGLAALLYEDGPLKELGSHLKQDLYVFPLSVHEAVVFPWEEWSRRQVHELSEQISVSKGCLWYYSARLNKIAFSEITWEKYMAALKYGIVDAAERR